MAETPVIIELGGQKFIRTTDMKVLTLFRQAATASAKSMRTYGDVDYQVPVGKVFVGLEFSFASLGTGSGTVKFSDETSANVENSANRVAELDGYDGNVNKMNFNHTFVAGRYIGCQATSTACSILITGVEMDA